MFRLSILLLSCYVFTGCLGPGDTPVELPFTVADFAGRERIAVRSLQFDVHDVVLLGGDGNNYVYRYAANAPWQAEEIALIDLAGADGQRSHVLHGYPAGRPVEGFTGIRFVVGVPFDLNHANPLTAEPPLNRTDLLRTWQTGYKFLRAELAEEDMEWAFHLGSTGCASAAAVRPPPAEWGQPNRMTAAGGREVPDGQHRGDGRAHPRKSPFVKGFELTAQEREDLLSFLRSLSDDAFLSDDALADPF